MRAAIITESLNNQLRPLGIGGVIQEFLRYSVQFKLGWLKNALVHVMEMSEQTFCLTLH